MAVKCKDVCYAVVILVFLINICTGASTTAEAEGTSPPTTTKTTTLSTTISTPNATTLSTTTTTNGTTVTTITPAIMTTTAPLQPDMDAKAPVNKYKFKCILVEMGVKLNFTYNMTTGNTTQMKTIQWNIPTEFNVTNASSCDKPTGHQSLVVSFFEGWTLELVFTNISSSKKFNVSEVIVSYVPDHTRFHNITGADQNERIVVSSTAAKIEWNSGSGYKCSSDQKYEGFNNTAGLVSVLEDMHTASVQIEAFRKDESDTFGKSVTSCQADQSVSNIVPIAVGAALAGLVLIVLIAYLIGRRRNKRGYESV